MDPNETPAQRSARLRSIAEDAARAVGPMLRGAFRSELAITQKSNHHDLVTVYDKASEEAIAEHVLSAEPDSRILGEEGGHRGRGRVEWIVDPIDGTSNFAHGVAFFCVSIAAALDGEVVAGVVYDPVAELLFSADSGGAYLNGGVLRPAAHAEESRASIMTDYPSAEALALDGPAGLEAFAELVGTYATLRRKVSGALMLAHVAAGWADITLGFDTNPWDVAAGAFLVRQSGGSYLPFRYDDESRPAHEAPTYLAVGPGGNAATALSVVERLMASRRAAGHRKG
ncbi:inositol monophosphatase family protein [Zafaria sp. Z1313]|uniref:inositol monophosphatase family protein n=1 Tax=unclassified Zafaria TaxID=2828765 RepID=UPI002E793109|nr:inositol monophosphatase family protein [Zafaria sp. J156]MEE1622282.1 inositol monophosphatase family protein [Zafaria sp. J156]